MKLQVIKEYSKVLESARFYTYVDNVCIQGYATEDEAMRALRLIEINHFKPEVIFEKEI